MRSWSRSRSRATRDADDVGPRRQELAELDVGRAEPRQRRGEPGGAVAGVAALDQPRQAQEAAPGRRQHARIDERERALARQHEAGADVAPEMDERSLSTTSNLPARVERDDAAGQQAVGHAPEARRRDHAPRTPPGSGSLRIDSTR